MSRHKFIGMVLTQMTEIFPGKPDAEKILSYIVE